MRRLTNKINDVMQSGFVFCPLLLPFRFSSSSLRVVNSTVSEEEGHSKINFKNRFPNLMDRLFVPPKTMGSIDSEND